MILPAMTMMFMQPSTVCRTPHGKGSHSVASEPNTPTSPSALNGKGGRVARRAAAFALAELLGLNQQQLRRADPAMTR